MPKITIQIEFDPAIGSVQVSGPLHDGILMMGLLEMAKRSIQPLKDQKAEVIHLKKQTLILPEQL
jgi:hypothetical protein